MLRAPYLRKSNFRQLIIACSLTFTSTFANASYTVIEDDLMPPALLEQVSPTSYSMLFSKGHSQLSPNMKTMLDSLVPMMRGATVRIIGRPDAVSVRKGKLSQLAKERGEAIRIYLLRQGVPNINISVDTDESPNPQANGNLYPSDLIVSKINPRSTAQYVGQASVPARLTSTSGYKQLPGNTPKESNEPAQTATSPSGVGSRAQLIQFINQSVQSGQMDATVALRLMRSLLDNEQASSPTVHSSAYDVSTASVTAERYARQNSVPPTAVPVFVATPMVSSWTLDKALNLRENIDVWARNAGWSPIVWESSNHYQVTITTVVQGDFPGVLRQIADSTGLNICATPRDKKIRITDATVSCK